MADKIGKYRLRRSSRSDTRVEKSITIGRTQVAFDADVFNALNSGTVLGRIYDVSSSKFNQVRRS